MYPDLGPTAALVHEQDDGIPLDRVTRVADADEDAIRDKLDVEGSVVIHVGSTLPLSEESSRTL